MRLYILAINFILLSCSKYGMDVSHFNLQSQLANTEAVIDAEPTPTATPISAPEIQSIIINSDDLYSNTQTVSIEYSLVHDENAQAICLTQTNTSPSINDSCWDTDVTSPNAFVFDSDGNKTVYAFVKGVEESISTSLSDEIIVDTTNPTSATILIRTDDTLFASGHQSIDDDVDINIVWDGAADGGSGLAAVDTYSVYIYDEAISGCAIGGVNSASAVATSNLTGTNYVYSGANGNSYKAQVKVVDQVGKFSWSACSDAILIDTQVPSVASISIDAAATYGVRLVSVAYSVSDNIAVTAVCIQESATAPALGDGCWDADITSPNAYTFASDGNKTLYIFARDLVGNISTSLNDTIIVDILAPVAATAVIEESTDIDIDYDGSVTWYWTAGSDATSGVASYRLYTYEAADVANCGVNTTNAVLRYTGTGTNTAAVAGLTVAETYYGAVLITDNAGLTTWSACSDGVTIKTYPVATDDTASSAEITAVTFNLLTNDTDADGDALSVSSIDTSTITFGALVNNGNGSVTYTPPADYAGTQTFSYVVSDVNGNTDTGSVTVRTTSNYEWDGSSGNGEWNTAANWRGNAVPDNTRIAYFYDTACTPNCIVTINAPGANVLGVRIQSDFSGTINQGVGQTLTVGTKSYTQRGGTFNGSDANINVAEFYLHGGVFVSTDATLFVGYDIGVSDNTNGFTISSDAVFDNNEGTVEFDWTVRGNCSHNVAMVSNIANGVEFYNLVIDLYNNVICGNQRASWYGVAGHAPVVVENDLTIQSGIINANIDIELYGNIIAECPTVAVPSVCSIGGGRKITLKGNNNQTYNVANNAFLPHLVINKTGGSVTPTGNGIINVTFFDLLAGNFTAPSSTMTMYHNANDSTASIGMILSAGTIFNHNNGLLKITGVIRRNGHAGNVYYFINNSGDPFYDVIIDIADTEVANGYNEATLSLNGSQPYTIEGDLELHNGYYTGVVNLEGNFKTECAIAANTQDCAYIFTTLNFTGPNPQTITIAPGTVGNGDIVINKTNNTDTVTFLTDWDYSAATDSDLTLTRGTLELGAFNFGLSDDLSVTANGDITCTTGGWSVLGTASGAGLAGLSCP